MIQVLLLPPPSTGEIPSPLFPWAMLRILTVCAAWGRNEL